MSTKTLLSHLNEEQCREFFDTTRELIRRIEDYEEYLKSLGITTRIHPWIYSDTKEIKAELERLIGLLPEGEE